MTQPNPTIPVAVTQADREAAASYGRYRIYSGLGADGIAAGRADRDDLVQAFARHRLAHQPNPLAGEVERLREALKVSHDAITEFYRYWTGGEMRGSYDGRPERDGLWKAMYASRAALKDQTHDH